MKRFLLDYEDSNPNESDVVIDIEGLDVTFKPDEEYAEEYDLDDDDTPTGIMEMSDDPENFEQARQIIVALKDDKPVYAKWVNAASSIGDCGAVPIRVVQQLS